VSDAEPAWRQLFRQACSLIEQVNSKQLIIDSWSFGGGTAMMLQIDHRDSRDIDIFLSDPQLLRFLDPETNTLRFEMRPSQVTGDGIRHLKFAFDPIGEIDFIVATPLTPLPTTWKEIAGISVRVETIAEIISKKIVHRASHIAARDMFDLAAAAAHDRASIVAALRPFKTHVSVALNALGARNPEFVGAAIANLAIKEKYRPIAETAVQRAAAILAEALGA